MFFFPPVCGDVGVSGTSWNLFELKQMCVFDVMVLLVVACAFIAVFVDFLQNPSNTSSGPFSTILDLYCGSIVQFQDKHILFTCMRRT